jgi:hypothetical protein
MDLEEISDRETLLHLMGCFYTDAKRNHPILEEMIRTVHSHTLAVELSARLLEIGIMEPEALLNKFKEEKTAMDATDTIGFTKDGRSRKATYYDHLHPMIQEIAVEETKPSVLNCRTFAPLIRHVSRWHCGELL